MATFRRLLPLLASCAVLSVVPPAHAVTIASAGNAMQPRLQAWADAATVPTAPITLTVRPEACWQFRAEACTMFGASLALEYPDLEYLWSGAQGSAAAREAAHLNFLHELGHVYDFTQRVHPYRPRFLRILGIQDAESARAQGRLSRPAGWLVSGQLQPDELFAMAYSYCADGLTYAAAQQTMRNVYWGYGYAPTRRQYDAICKLLRTGH